MTGITNRLCSFLGGVALSLAVSACRHRTVENRWYRGNLHVHSLWSDGAMLPEEVADWYKRHGYQFLGLSDHNIVPVEERWVDASKVLLREPRRAMSSLVSRTHDGIEEVRLKTINDLKREFDAPGQFLLLCDEEITSTAADHPVHVTAVNLKNDAVASVNAPTAADAISAMLDGVDHIGKIEGYPTLGFINHPNFAWAVGASDLAAVRGARFVEVFNGHPFTASRGDTGKRPVTRMWDMANAERVLERHWAPLFGVASDDAHVETGAREASPGRGWIYVRASSLQPAALLRSMQRGDFYASTGVRLKNIAYDRAGRALSLTIDPEPGATYVTEFIVTKSGAHPRDDKPNDRWDVPTVGVVASKTTTLMSRYKLASDDVLARAVITASTFPENPILSDYAGDAVQFKQAFTQPVGWEGGPR
jgi:hypothetical protein